MAKTGKKSNKGKRIKKRIKKRRLFMLIAVLAVLVFSVFRIGGIIGQAIKGTQEIEMLEDEFQQQMKQFDLRDEVNKDLDKKYTVMIDPGHGGYDNGTANANETVLEKDLALLIAKRVANNLSQHNDIQVILSRTEDVYMSLADRAKFANDKNVDVLVSIHLNAEGSGDTADGIETYYNTGATSDSKKLAGMIQKRSVDYTGAKDRGVKHNSYQVLAEANMPAVLVECGFLTNQEETKMLLQAEYQENLAEGITQGILAFLDEKGKSAS